MQVNRINLRIIGVSLALIGALLSIGCRKSTVEKAAAQPLGEELIGTWFAYNENVIQNMWTFRRDGTCTNDGWPGSGINDTAAPPYHLEGKYTIGRDRIDVLFPYEGGADTVSLRQPAITHNRLVYSVGPTDVPIIFLREREAVVQDVAVASDDAATDPELSAKLVGSWVAFANGFPDNTWTFNADGTFTNEGWEPLDPRVTLIRRQYQVNGRYTVSGNRVVLTNERMLQFDPKTNRIDAEVPLSERIVLYNVSMCDGRLVYTNEVGLPVAFRPGVVTPTNW